MHSTSSETLVAAGPAPTYDAVVDLVRRMWAVADADIVEAQPPSRLVHGVSLDGQIACWLSWELTAVGADSTRVRLVHDELDTRPVPAPELDAVLAMLRTSVVTRAVDGEDAR